MNKYTIKYLFTSVRADGDEYMVPITIDAKSRQSAEAQARLVGFDRFGARFNDNCVDWRVTEGA
jgi:hypothetical protein